MSEAPVEEQKTLHPHGGEINHICLFPLKYLNIAKTGYKYLFPLRTTF